MTRSERLETLVAEPTREQLRAEVVRQEEPALYEVHDYGFDLPDTKHTFMDEEGRVIAVVIRRDWFETEDHESDYRVGYDITVDGKVELSLPAGTTLVAALGVAQLLHPVDEEATAEIHEDDQMAALELRTGA